MEQGGSRALGKRRRKRLACVCVVLALLVVAVLVLVLVLTLRERETNGFKAAFMEKCEKFKGSDCQNIWKTFEQAYVGRDPCEVPVEAYDDLIAAAPINAECNRMIFWSKTKVAVHEFTQRRDCFITMEDTLLGRLLDGQTWCGREGSGETFTSGCPGWNQCENNPVRSFWNRASAAFADAACGDISAMLNGSVSAPFSPTSVFGSIEIKRFNSTKIRKLDVVLVTQDQPVSNCTNPSLQNLQDALEKGIAYNCKEVTESQLQKCSSDPMKPCGRCW